MSKDSVVVNGITLTRAQIEDAVKRLNEPETFRPRAGTHFTFGSDKDRYVVVDRSVLSEAHSFKSGFYAVRDDGKMSYFTGTSTPSWYTIVHAGTGEEQS